MSVELIIADDHPLLLKGLRDFLEENNFNILAQANNGKDALTLIEKHKPNIAILDLEMPEMTGLEVATACKTKKIKTKIILLTLHKEIFILHQAKTLNISGYLLKDFAIEELINCIQKINVGEEYYSDKLFPEHKNNLNSVQNEKLTPSEIKILKLIADGLTSKEIASKLFVAERTVDKHRSNIISKMNLDKKHNSLLIWAQNNKGTIF